MGLRASGSLFHSAMLPIAHTGVGARNLLEPGAGMEIESGIAIAAANVIAQCTVQMQHSQKREAANRGATNDTITNNGLDRDTGEDPRSRSRPRHSLVIHCNS